MDEVFKDKLERERSVTNFRYKEKEKYTEMKEIKTEYIIRDTANS